MNTAWSIYSGGRLNSQLAQKAVFKITTDETLESVLFSSESLKQAFANKLRQKLSGLSVSENYQHTFTVNFQSEVVEDEFAKQDVELTVWVMDDESDSIFWYFILRSAAINISTEHSDEIVSLIASRLCPEKEAQKSKCWL